MVRVLVPGAVAAGTAIDLPEGTPPVQELRSAYLLNVTAGAKALAVVDSGPPAAGQVFRSSENQVVLGDATVAGDALILELVSEGKYLEAVGKVLEPVP